MRAIKKCPPILGKTFHTLKNCGARSDDAVYGWSCQAADDRTLVIVNGESDLSGEDQVRHGMMRGVVMSATDSQTHVHLSGGGQPGTFGKSAFGPGISRRPTQGTQAIALKQEIGRLRQRLRQSHLDSVMALVAALEAKDPHTERHSSQVAIYAEHLATAAGLGSADVEVLVIAALLHDIGKIAIPDAILLKPGRLTPNEFEIIKLHPARGVEILGRMGFLERELPLVLHHHEWFNGSGYPAGLAGTAIPYGARILQVADSIDAMLSPRTYKKAISVEEAIAELKRWRGIQFDPAIAESAVAMLERQPEEALLICPRIVSVQGIAAESAPWPAPSLAVRNEPAFVGFGRAVIAH